jgi:hypothetical protein
MSPNSCGRRSALGPVRGGLDVITRGALNSRKNGVGVSRGMVELHLKKVKVELHTGKSR